MSRTGRDGFRLAACLAVVALVTWVYTRWLDVSNAAIVSTTFLLVAATWHLWLAIVTSMAAMLCLNFFFLPPVGTLAIVDPQNWAALFAFLAVSLVASHLSAVARTRTEEAVSRRDELTRLFDLSRDVLMMTDSREAISLLARSVARRFDLDCVVIALPRDGGWDTFQGGRLALTLDDSDLSQAFAEARVSLEFDAYSRTYAGHRVARIDERQVHLVPLRVGTKPVGVLAATGRPIEPGTLDTLAGVVAIAIERAHLLEERKEADLTRQSEQLKTALLASLGHDLRTPLTAIRVAAANVKASWLGEQERAEQSDLILAEVERLTRLFENVLEMARIDAGALASETRWTHPSEIIAAASDRVEHTLRQHTLEVTIDPDVPVRIDPRLTAAAVAHLLENAAQYSPPATVISILSGATAEGLRVTVRDRGAGIDAADLPHLFDRFYRGAAAKSRTSGTGMGLWIARGLLAVQQGRVWAENCPDGGAQFSVVIPAAVKAPEPVLSSTS